MAKEELIEAEGVVVEAVKNKFRVKLDENGHEVMCHPGGKLRKNYIRIVPGDQVKIQMSPYDLTNGRIVYRYK